MRWICSTKEATGLNVQEPRGAVETGQGGRHTFTGWLGVGVNTAAPATPSSLHDCTPYCAGCFEVQGKDCYSALTKQSQDEVWTYRYFLACLRWRH